MIEDRGAGRHEIRIFGYCIDPSGEKADEGRTRFKIVRETARHGIR